MHFHFEWDPDNASANLKKHRVSFEQAAEIFKDPIALTVYDEDNSDDEERWVTLGRVQQQHFLVVVHTYHDSESNVVRIRIISARPATRPEIKQYENG